MERVQVGDSRTGSKWVPPTASCLWDSVLEMRVLGGPEVVSVLSVCDTESFFLIVVVDRANLSVVKAARALSGTLGFVSRPIYLLTVSGQVPSGPSRV